MIYVTMEELQKPNTFPPGHTSFLPYLKWEITNSIRPTLRPLLKWEITTSIRPTVRPLSHADKKVPPEIFIGADV